MTWTISHGTPGGSFGGYHSRSYSQVAEWRDALLQVPLSNRDLAIVEPLTRRRSGDPFSVEPRRALAIAGVLRSVHRRMPRAQRELNGVLAAAAERASAAGQKWEWS
jgi:hypothetical protein